MRQITIGKLCFTVPAECCLLHIPKSGNSKSIKLPPGSTIELRAGHVPRKGNSIVISVPEYGICAYITGATVTVTPRHKEERGNKQRKQQKGRKDGSSEKGARNENEKLAAV